VYIKLPRLFPLSLGEEPMFLPLEVSPNVSRMLLNSMLSSASGIDNYLLNFGVLLVLGAELFLIIVPSLIGRFELLFLGIGVLIYVFNYVLICVLIYVLI